MENLGVLRAFAVNCSAETETLLGDRRRLRLGGKRSTGNGKKGNHLDLWQAVTGLPIYEAAIDLPQRLGIESERIRNE